MASKVGSDESKVTTDPSAEVDYVALLNRNIVNTKQKLTEQFVRIRKILDEKETSIMKHINEIHEQKQQAVGNLQEMRTQTIALHKLMSKNVSPIQLGPGSIGDSVVQLTEQLNSLTRVEDDWNLNRVEELLLDVKTDSNSNENPKSETKISAEFEIHHSITKGNESQLGHLSKELGGMECDEETGNIFIADRGNNCLQVYSRDGSYLLTISHELLVAPGSIAISGEYVYSCNNRLGECYPTQQKPCDCHSRNRTCNFHNQFLYKFSKRDGQMISFTNISASFGLISATNKTLYLYSCGYSEDFKSKSNELSILARSNVNQIIVTYDEVFQPDKSRTLSLEPPQSIGCLNCQGINIPVTAIKAFEDEVSLLYRDTRVISFNSKTKLRREISVTTNIPRIPSYLCWDGENNGKLILTDTQNNQLIVVSQLGRFHLAIDVKNKEEVLIPPVAISRHSNLFYSISSNGDEHWMLHRLKLV